MGCWDLSDFSDGSDGLDLSDGITRTNTDEHGRSRTYTDGQVSGVFWCGLNGDRFGISFCGDYGR